MQQTVKQFRVTGMQCSSMSLHWIMVYCGYIHRVTDFEFHGFSFDSGKRFSSRTLLMRVLQMVNDSKRTFILISPSILPPVLRPAKTSINVVWRAQIFDLISFETCDTVPSTMMQGGEWVHQGIIQQTIKYEWRMKKKLMDGWMDGWMNECNCCMDIRTWIGYKKYCVTPFQRH